MSRPSTVVRLLTITGILCTTVAVAFPLSDATTAVDQPLSCYFLNPDVAGIGVRVALYTQSILLFITTLLCIADGVIDSRERKALEKTYTNLLVTAFALLIAAFAQAATSQLSLYHAILVLNSSLLVAANAFVLAILPAMDDKTELNPRKFVFLVFDTPALFFFSIHLSLLGSFGIYVWSNPTRLWDPTKTASADPVECLRNTIAYVFFFGIQASNHKLRITSILSYTIAAYPILNVFLLVATVVVLVNFINRLIPATYGGRITWAVQAVLNIIIMFEMESFIRRNQHLILDNGESTWGLGQTIALILTISPVIDGLTLVGHKLNSKTKGRLEYRYRGFLRRNESWPSFRDRMCGRIDSVVAELRSHPDARARGTIVHALTGAIGFLHAANATISSSPYDIPLPSSGPNSTQSSQIEIPPNGAQVLPNWSSLRDQIDGISEDIAKIRKRRFREVDNTESYLAVNRYLAATRCALSTAKAALGD